MKKVMLIVGLIFLGGGFLIAQSNFIIDLLIQEKQATFGKTAYLVLSAGELIEEDASVAETLDVMEEQKWRLRDKNINEPVTEAEFSYLVMQAMKIRGGIMYTLFPSPRYAFRELKFYNLIKGTQGPTRIVSGEFVINTLGKIMQWKEENQ